jgi:hypothetical protein
VRVITNDGHWEDRHLPLPAWATRGESGASNAFGQVVGRLWHECLSDAQGVLWHNGEVGLLNELVNNLEGHIAHAMCLSDNGIIVVEKAIVRVPAVTRRLEAC